MKRQLILLILVTLLLGSSWFVEAQIVSNGNAGNGGSASPSGPAGGDLSGTYPNPGVAQIQGFPVANSTPASGCVLTGTGSSYACTATPTLAATPIPAPGFIFPNYQCSSNGAGIGNSANALYIVSVVLPSATKFSHIGLAWSAGDNTHSYDWGLYNSSGTLIADIGATAIATATWATYPVSQGTVTAPAGMYFEALTGNAATAKIYGCTASNFPAVLFYENPSFGSSTAGALPATIAAPTASPVGNSQNLSGSFVLLNY